MIHMLPYQISMITIQKKGHIKTINLKYLLQHGMINLSYLADHTM